MCVFRRALPVVADLESQNGLVELLIIDTAGNPSENQHS